MSPGLDQEAELNSFMARVFRSAKERMQLSYPVFFDRLKKLDELRLIDVQHRNERGRTRDIVLRYEAELVVAVCG